MKNILPKEEICDLFDKNIVFEEYHLEDINRLREIKPRILFGLALIIWTRIVEFGLFPVDPSAINEYIERMDPDTFRRVSKILGTNIIRDVYYAKAEIEAAGHDDLGAYELFVAHIYPNNLHIADIAFFCPDKPLYKKNLSALVREHENLYNRLIDNAVACGRSKGCNYLMFTAKSSHQVEIFLKRGFLIEDHMTERQSLDLGMGIPMVRQVGMDRGI